MTLYTVGLSMWVQRTTEVVVEAKTKAEAKAKALLSHDDCWEFGTGAKPITVTYVEREAIHDEG